MREGNPALIFYEMIITNPGYLEQLGYIHLGHPATIYDIDCNSFLRWAKYIDDLEDYYLNGTGDPSNPPLGLLKNEDN